MEEITPCCVLELLALPLTEENRIRREEGLQRVRNILWAVGGGGAAAIAGGFTRDEFMRQAFLYMTASEQVFLLSLCVLVYFCFCVDCTFFGFSY